MPTQISEANFKLALGRCYDAIDQGDLAAARKHYALAEVQHAGLSSGVSGDGISRTRRQNLDAVIKAIEVAEQGSDPWELHSRMVP